MKISAILLFSVLATTPSAFGSHIFFSQVTGNGTLLSEDGTAPTLVLGPSVTFETFVSGPDDSITFDFINPGIPDFSFYGSGLVSFSRIVPTGIAQSVFVDLVSSFPDYVNTNAQSVDGQTFFFQAQNAGAVPEPGTVALLGGGLTALIAFSRARRKADV